VTARALLTGVALAVASSSSARVDGCPASTVEVADWAIVRSARVPGFTLRLPRSFTRDTTASSRELPPSARWSDAARGRFAMSHLAPTATTPTPLPGADVSSSTRCDTSVGAATATIVTYADGPSAYIVHAQLRWPDGEAVEVHANAASRAHVELLIAAVRTIRRAGA
jgi:hypothetical protein